MAISEIIKKKTERILLIGHSAHGKTYTAVQVSKNMALKDKKVLYLDCEYGSLDEWKNAIDSCDSKEAKEKIDKNVGLVNPEDFLQLMKYVSDYKDKVDLIVIDPLSYNTEARITAKQELLRYGKVWRGEKEIEIKDKRLFHLTGFDYQLPNEWQAELLRMMSKSKCSFLVTDLVSYKIGSHDIVKMYNDIAEDKIPKKLRELFDVFGYFDRVILMERDASSFYGIVLKWRGLNITGKKIDDVAKVLTNSLLIKEVS